jgi:hypothetical protein
VGKELEVDTRRIKRENRMMEKEYLFHKDTTQELEETAVKLRAQIKSNI